MARSQRAAIALLAALALIGGCASPGWNKAGGPEEGKPVVLTLANFLGDSGDLYGFAEEVQRLSAGAMRINIESRWRLHQVGFETGLIGDVEAGKADLGVVGAGSWSLLGVNSFQALDAPLLIDSYALQARVLRSPLIGQMLGGLRPLGIAGIGVLPGQLRKPLGITRPLRGPADYAGLRIGTQQSRVADATMRALGARPVWFGSEAPVAGLGGIEQQISQIQDTGYDQAGKYLTANVSLWPRPLVLFAGRKTWDALTPVQQRVLQQAATGDLTAGTQVVRGNEQTDTAILCRRGLHFLTATPADLAALRRAVQPVYDQLERDPETRGYIQQIEAMGKGISPEPAPGCAQVPRLAGQRGQLDGVWQFTSTPADLRAVGTPQGDIVPENYGTFTIVIDRGQFAFTQETRRACVWGYGTFIANGNEFDLLFTNGGGIAPDGSANKPGELFAFRWSLYRGVLTVYPGNDAAPPPFLAKPWLRISASPSPRFLSTRCLPPTGALPR